MLRFLGYIIRLALLLAVILWLADRPGTARIVWHDYVIETSAAMLALGALAVGFVFYLLFRFWHLMKHGPERWRLHRKLQRMRRGQDNLTAGLIAIAGGNAFEAGRLAVSARKWLGTTPATQWLQATAAQLAGDRRAAKTIYRDLAAHNTSAPLGYRGLIMEARREGDWAEVESLVEKLRAAKPDTPWLHLLRFELLARRQDWDNAADALAKATQYHLIEPERARHIRAVVLAASAQSAAKHFQPAKALPLAEQAAKLDPHLPSAQIVLAQMQMQAGQRRAGLRTIERNWKNLPHAQLAALYREAIPDRLEAYRQMEKLCRATIDAPESRLALAETALAADIWGEARRHLIVLVSRGLATQKAYRMMAKLERRESGDEQAALQWLIKAGDAPHDPTWICTQCGGGQAEWQGICAHCGSFDSLHWHSPGTGLTSPKASFPLLPSDEIF